jgi:hypothetical protein
MCKTLISVETYGNTRTAFKTLETLKAETGLAFSMFTACPDIDGHVLHTIYGLFENEDIETARTAINENFDYDITEMII